MKRIVVLMSTYNGHSYLSEQMESIVNQVIPNDFELSILVRDDGSLDNTVDIISKFSNRVDVSLYVGENIGPARSFWDLVNAAPDADYYAFCDQDDVWFDNKINHAINVLMTIENASKPLLYCSAVNWTDSNLNPLPIYYSTEKKIGFPQALLYSISPGCTYVFNKAALDIARKYDFSTGHVEIHDWLLYKIIAMLGTVYYDDKPTMYYRQHDNNAIGRKNDGILGFIHRIVRFLTSDARGRSKTASSLIKFYKDDISVKSKEYYYLDLVANYRYSLYKRIRFILDKEFRRSPFDTFFLIIFGKV